jgi:hypothetical protein
VVVAVELKNGRGQRTASGEAAEVWEIKMRFRDLGEHLGLLALPIGFLGLLVHFCVE